MPNADNQPNDKPTRSSYGPTRSSYGALAIAAVAGVALIGGIGIGITQNNNSDATNQQIEEYIRNNPELIIEVLTQYSRDREKADQQQGINLVKSGNDLTVMGNPDGDVTIYEFSDYNCGYCKRSFASLMNVIKSDGNIRVVIKEFPILADSSVTAARLTMAAAELGQFEALHTELMLWPGRLDERAFDAILANVGLERKSLEAIIAKGEIDARIQQNRQAASALNINGTPGFIIGDAVIPGAIDQNELARLVAEARKNNRQ